MKNYISIFYVIFLHILTLTSTIADANIQRGPANNVKNYEVNYDFYIDKNGEMTPEYQNLIDREPNPLVKAILKSAFSLASWKKQIRYSFGKSIIPKQNNGQTQGFIDCTFLTYEVYKRAKDFLPVDQNFSNSVLSTNHASTLAMVASDSIVKEHFDYIEPYSLTKKTYHNGKTIGIKSFKPKAGDILAYNYSYTDRYKRGKQRGHAVIVIDPEQCIALNSTSAVFVENNGVIKRNYLLSGVYFQKVEKGICQDGIWTSWDRDLDNIDTTYINNNWDVLLRHKDVTDANISAITEPTESNDTPEAGKI